MPDSVLLLVKSDPSKSPRPVEAVRIALGLVSGELPVTIVLMNNAPALLGEDAEDLMDGEILQKYLPAFRELGQIFYVEKNAFKEIGLEESDYRIETVSINTINDLVKKAGRSFIF